MSRMSSDGRLTAADPRRIGRPGSYSTGVARRQEILDRAIEVFRERGADGTSLRRIASAIGVSHAALLHYFASREELLVAVYAHAEARRDAEEVFADADGAVDVMVTAAMLNTDVPGIVELYSTLVATAISVDSGPARDYFGARFERVRDELARRFRTEQADGRMRADVDAEDMASLLIAASDGLQIQWLLDPSVELQRTLEALTVLMRP